MDMYMSSIFAACISSAVMGCVSSCESSPLRDRIMGFGCAWDNRVNFTNVAEHECVLRCMLDKSCTAANYDVQDRVCMWMEVPCPVLKTQQYTHYQILAPPPLDGCVHWVATNDRNYPRMVKYNSSPNGYNLIGIVRLRRAGELLPAFWSQRNEKAVTVQNNTKFMSKAIEVLVAKESGPRLNIKTVLSTYGDFHVKDKTAVRTLVGRVHTMMGLRNKRDPHYINKHCPNNDNVYYFVVRFTRGVN